MTHTSLFAQVLRRLTIVSVLALGLSLPFGCSTEEATCDGVLIDGVCEPKCDPGACAVIGSTCFQNNCAAPCQGHEFCPVGQNCAGLIGEDGQQGNFCYTLPFAKNGLTGQFDPCTGNETCDVERGFRCLAGVCTFACTAHADCANFGGYCKTDATGASTCVKGDASAPPGRFEPCTESLDCDQIGAYHCHEGECRPQCTSHGDCSKHGGFCKADPTGALGCIKDSGKPPGQGGACQTSKQCDAAGGYKCVDGECRLYGCRTHEDCAAVGLCKPGKLDTGEKTTACFKDTVHPKGQYGTRCTEGTSGECDTAKGFVCIGAGPGDVDAYCTGTGCSADSNCPTGFFCSTVRTGRPPCEATCTGVDPEPTDANCVKPADIGAGKEYSCGPISLLRNLCLKREYCNDCETDADCLGIAGQICAKDTKGNKKCTVICDPEVSGACPWGTASSCAVTDTDVGVPTCSHRFGACEAAGKSCEPCIDDADCPGGLCLGSDFTQERYCLDLSVSCDCTGLPLTQGTYCIGGGCPKTPGGLNMRCFGGNQVPATSLLLNKCYGAQIQQQFGGSPQTACWPK